MALCNSSAFCSTFLLSHLNIVYSQDCVYTPPSPSPHEHSLLSGTLFSLGRCFSFAGRVSPSFQDVIGILPTLFRSALLVFFISANYFASGSCSLFFFAPSPRPNSLPPPKRRAFSGRPSCCYETPRSSITLPTNLYFGGFF